VVEGCRAGSVLRDHFGTHEGVVDQDAQLEAAQFAGKRPRDPAEAEEAQRPTTQRTARPGPVAVPHAVADRAILDGDPPQHGEQEPDRMIARSATACGTATG